MKKLFFALVFLFSLTAFAAEDNQKDSFDKIELVKDFDQKIEVSVKVVNFEVSDVYTAVKTSEAVNKVIVNDINDNSISRLYKNKRSPVLNELAFRTVKDKPKLT